MFEKVLEPLGKLVSSLTKKTNIGKKSVPKTLVLEDMNKRVVDLLEKENEERKKEKVAERQLANAKEYTHKVMKDNDERYKIVKMYKDGEQEEFLAVTKSKRLHPPVDTNYDSNIPIYKHMFSSEKRLRFFRKTPLIFRKTPLIFRKTPRIARLMRKKSPLEKKTPLLEKKTPVLADDFIR